MDDALGEAFDKIGESFRLKVSRWSRGRKKALKGNEKAFVFPKPLLRKTNEDLNLSFSGLKSHIIKLVNENKSNLRSKNL